MEGLKIEKVTLDTSAAQNVLETAVNAGVTYGIGYWAEILEARETIPVSNGRMNALVIREIDPRPDSPIDEAMLGAGNVQADGTIVVTADAIARAVERMLMDPKGTEANDCALSLLVSEWPDGALADCIIQVACFGKLVYA